MKSSSNDKNKNLPPLSERLAAVAGMVTPGNRAADVGCDHGYTAIYLRLAGISPFCICTDINKGPLTAAEENIKKYGADGIRTICADGLSGVRPGEADSIIIAGMGGELICRILELGAEVTGAAKELVLGPHSEPEKVRRKLRDPGFFITDERMIFEDGKYYPVIKAEKPADGTKSPADRQEEIKDIYGPVLLAKRDPVLKQYLEREENTLEKVLENLSARGRNIPETEERKAAVEHLLFINRTAQEYYK